MASVVSLQLSHDNHILIIDNQFEFISKYTYLLPYFIVPETVHSDTHKRYELLVKTFVLARKNLEKKVPYSIIPKYFHSIKGEDNCVNIKVIYWKLNYENSTLFS